MTPTTYGRDFAYCLKSHGGVRGFNASLWRFLLRCTLFCHSVATFLTSVSSYEGGCGFEVIDIQQASVGPSKTASPLRNYVKIKVDNENTSFWYDINNEPKPVGTKCILSVQKGFFGLRFVENVDFLVE